jgi:hypothetical protein
MPLGANKAAIMGVAGVSTGDVVLLSSQTASGDSEIDFSSGITSTYGEYIFGFYNINPATDDAEFGVQFNVAGQSGHNETITSTFFSAYLGEDGSGEDLSYQAGHDQAEGTALQTLAFNQANDADGSCAGKMHLFNPASTTYVKHFSSRISSMNGNNEAVDMNASGYVNVTGAVDEVQFKMSTGDFDGKIKMWGVK